MTIVCSPSSLFMNEGVERLEVSLGLLAARVYIVDWGKCQSSGTNKVSKVHFQKEEYQ